MKRALISTVLVVALAMLLLRPGQTQAEIITFGTVGHVLTNDGPLTEGSFTYEATVGTGWEIQTTFGNPVAALATFFDNESSQESDEVKFARTDGGLFTFDSVDFLSLSSPLSANPPDQLLFSGFLGSSLIGTLPLEYSSTFQTVSSGISGAIDRLMLNVTFHSSVGSGAIVDNLVLTPVPEPSAFVLWLLAGAAPLGFVWRKSRRAE